jgi:hypothetical protein
MRVVTTALLVAQTAWADAAQDCRAQYADLHYREAVASCTRALQSATAGERTELYVLIGSSLAATGDADQAQRVFVSLLAVDPRAELPKGASPKLREPFEAARALAAPVQLSARLVEAPREGGEAVVLAEVHDGAAQPVTEVTLTVDGAVARAARTAEPARLTVPAGSRGASARVRALDLLGGELASVTLALSQTEPVAIESGRPAALSWKTWLVAGAVFAVLGGAALAWAATAYPQARAASDVYAAQGLHAQGDGASVASYVGFGLAGAAALGAVILFATR